MEITKINNFNEKIEFNNMAFLNIFQLGFECGQRYSEVEVELHCNISVAFKRDKDGLDNTTIKLTGFKGQNVPKFPMSINGKLKEPTP